MHRPWRKVKVTDSRAAVDFAACMRELTDVHFPEADRIRVDETSKQLIAETRPPIPMKTGRPARSDYEYERNGTANLFMMSAPLEGWRHIKVTDERDRLRLDRLVQR